MGARRRSSGTAGVAGTVLAGALVLLAPAAAGAAGPPPTTPAGSGGGCAANGQEIAGAARAPGAFGATVRGAAPIADENALFFSLFCS